jgi:hypothetical protein
LKIPDNRWKKSNQNGSKKRLSDKSAKESQQKIKIV